VANTPNSFWNGAVGFIDWLDAGITATEKLGAILCDTQILNSRLLDVPLSTMLQDMKGVVYVAAIFIPPGDYLHAIVFGCEHTENRLSNLAVLRHEYLNGVNVCSGDPA